MKRTATMLVLLATLGGCMSSHRKNDQVASVGCGGRCGGSPPMVPGVQDGYGQPVPMAAPYSAAPPGSMAARQMMANSVPLSMVQNPMPSGMPPLAAPSPTSGLMQTAASVPPGMGSNMMQAAYGAPPMSAPNLIPNGPGRISPPGVPFGPGGIPQGMGGMPPGMGGMPPGMGGMPAGMGGMPAGMGGMPPGMGGMPPGMGGIPQGMNGAAMRAGFVAPVPGVVAAEGGPPMQGPGGPKRSEVRFAGPAGMKVSWYGIGNNGQPSFGTNQIETPGRYNFLQAAIYRLKLSDIPNRPGIDLYPTLEVVPSNHRTDAFIAHSAVPVFFTEDDFDQVAAGNFLVKVIYLPYPQFQDIAAAGIDEIVSTRLEPGVDPIQEACKRGSILLIVRLGNIDLEAPNTPAMDAPGPNGGGMGGMGGNCVSAAGIPGLPAAPGVPMMGGPGMGMGMPMMGRPGMGMPMMGNPGMGMPTPAGGPVQMFPVKNAPKPLADPTVPMTKLPDTEPVVPVVHRPAEPKTPTPAQLAGQ